VKNLWENEEKYRLLADNMLDVIWSLDLKGQITYVSPSVKESLGYTQEEAMNLSLDRMFSPASAEKVVQNIREILKDPRPGKKRNPSKRLELEYFRKDGSRIWGETISSIMWDPAGNMIGLTGISRDITKRKRAEQALRKRESELKAKSRDLAEVNATLKVLIKQIKADQRECERNIVSNVKKLVLPYIDKLKTSGINKYQMSIINILESNLNNIISPFTDRLSSKFLSLSPMEVRLAALIKDGKTNKEMAELLCISKGTILTHRHRLRNKLGLKNKKVNLQAFLLSLKE
jgi:PAS domain S-box-containing protein